MNLRSVLLKCLALVCLLLMSTGCPKKKPSGCQSDSECSSGQTCQGGSCQAAACTAGATNCACRANNTCDAMLTCQAGTCQTCTAGSSACACRSDNTCDANLTCMNGVCAPQGCTPGTLSCACGTGNMCNTGLTCSPQHMCAACTPDVAGCPCTSSHTCNGGLACDATANTCRAAKTCAQSSCATHEKCTEATGGHDAVCLPQCDTGFMWNSTSMMCDANPAASCDPNSASSIKADCDSQNRACLGGDGGAACGTCNAAFTDVNGTLTTCRAVHTCSDIQSVCTSENKNCTPETTNGDAVCGTCQAGYMQSGSTCVLSASCDSDAGNYLTQCAVDHRSCVQGSDGGAACGGCLPGFAEGAVSGGACVLPMDCTTLGCMALGRNCPLTADGGTQGGVCGACFVGLVATVPGDPTSLCRSALTCATVSATCGNNEFCVEATSTLDAHCVAAMCPPTQAYNTATMACVDCGGTLSPDGGVTTCTAMGQTGRYWPFFSTTQGRCVCETQVGFYADFSNNLLARPCDADHDGWVRADAQSNIESVDPTISSNARCSLRTVDRVTLQNEYGERRDVLLCMEGLVPVEMPGAHCAASAPLGLYEPLRNDDQSKLDQANNSDVPTYGTTIGRRLRTEELNPLTKACIGLNADLNDNLHRDIDDWQGRAGSSPWDAFAYYVELHDGWYEPGQPYGRYVIAERSRCDPTFPVQYAAGDGTYSEGCVRKRDAQYGLPPAGFPTANPIPNVGFDFAKWDCPVSVAATGSCPTPKPPVAADGVHVPGYELCNQPMPPMPSTAPSDGQWRGMTHHSQFKCVHITTNAPASPEEQDRNRSPSQVYMTGMNAPERFNLCNVACPMGDPSCTADCVGPACTATSRQITPGTANPSRPVVTCAPQNMVSGTADLVGFVAELFKPYPTAPAGYLRGCISEGAEPDYQAFCPGYAANMQAGSTASDPNNFGKLQCGCDPHYGGPTCNLGCPDSDLFTAGYNPSPRQGWWMCGSPVLNDSPTFVHDGGVGTGLPSYTMVGGIPRTNTVGALCQDCDGGTGYRITAR